MIRAFVTGDKEVIAKLTSMPAIIANALQQEVATQTYRLQQHVQQNKLSGQVLKRRTGRLRASINTKVEREGNRIIGSVGTNVIYAAVHEFGFHGTVNVSSFTRTINGVTQNVSAHTRQMNMPQRSFLRSSLNDLKDQIQAGLVAAVNRAIKQ
jgi:phage gpG-like protein